MTDSLLDVILVLVLAWVAVLAATHVILALWDLPGQVVESIVEPFVGPLHNFAFRRRWKSIMEEVEQELGHGRRGKGIRQDIVQAAQHSQRIVVVHRMLKKTVVNCLRTHWAVAEGVGATHMSEAASHPLSEALRQRVIDITEVLSETLDEYPLLVESPELVRLQLGVQRLAPTCAACPYRTATVAEAPRICPAAGAFGQGGGSETGNDGRTVDAEIVDE